MPDQAWYYNALTTGFLPRFQTMMLDDPGEGSPSSLVACFKQDVGDFFGPTVNLSLDLFEFWYHLLWQHTVFAEYFQRPQRIRGCDNLVPLSLQIACPGMLQTVTDPLHNRKLFSE